MKHKYVASGKRMFTFSVWPVIAFGYYNQYHHYDAHHAQSFQSWYFLFFKLSATQYFAKFDK